MRISQLVQTLQEMQQRKGDAHVFLDTPATYVRVGAVGGVEHDGLGLIAVLLSVSEASRVLRENPETEAVYMTAGATTAGNYKREMN